VFFNGDGRSDIRDELRLRLEDALPRFHDGVRLARLDTTEARAPVRHAAHDGHPVRMAAVAAAVLAAGLSAALGLAGSPPDIVVPQPGHVSVTLVAGSTAADGGFNFNGYASGVSTVTVPLDWTDTVKFRNAATPPHSAVVLPFAPRQPAEAGAPAFPGAATPRPTSGLPRGATATFSFVASRTGTYEFACGVPDHAAAGMWDYLVVSPVARTASVAVRAPFAPRSGPGALDHPSLALELANGNIILNDDFNQRVIVLDRTTKRIIWQYGVTGVPGREPGYLRNPDGVDIKPAAFGR